MANWLTGWADNDLVTAAEFGKGWGCFYDHTTSGTDASLAITLPTWGADIRFEFQLASNTGSDSLKIIANADTGANYYQETATDFASSHAAGDTLGTTYILIGPLPNTANCSLSGTLNVRNYRGTSFYKHIHILSTGETGNASGNRFLNEDFGSWRSTAAMTTVTLAPLSGLLVTGSRVRGYVSG